MSFQMRHVDNSSPAEGLKDKFGEMGDRLADEEDISVGLFGRSLGSDSDTPHEYFVVDVDGDGDKEIVGVTGFSLACDVPVFEQYDVDIYVQLVSDEYTLAYVEGCGYWHSGAADEFIDNLNVDVQIWNSEYEQDYGEQYHVPTERIGGGTVTLGALETLIERRVDDVIRACHDDEGALKSVGIFPHDDDRRPGLEV